MSNKLKSEKGGSFPVDIRSQNQVLLQLAINYLEEDNLLNLRKLLSASHPSEIADLIETMPAARRLEFWNALDFSLRGEVIAQVSKKVRSNLLEQIDVRRVVTETQNLDSDELADILQELPGKIADEVLLSMDEQNRRRVGAALHYPQDTAGGIMNVEVTTIRQDVDVDVVLRFLRRFTPKTQNLDQLFVVSRNNHLIGAVSLVDLVIANPEVPISKLTTDVERPILAETSATEVTAIFEKFDLISAPVIDGFGKLIGAITVDDVVDVLRAENDKKIMSTAGIVEDYDMFGPFFMAARQRSLWLAVNLATAFLAAWVIGLFEGAIEKMVALAVLMPVVASMGGVAGTQSLTIVIRGMSLGQVGSANSWSVISREIGIGFCNGCLWAIVVGMVASLWFEDFYLGIIVAAAVVVNLVTAGFFGAAVPLLLRKIRLDPALAGGVILTTITDVMGFFAFLALAANFLLE